MVVLGGWAFLMGEVLLYSPLSKGQLARGNFISDRTRFYGDLEVSNAEDRGGYVILGMEGMLR